MTAASERRAFQLLHLVLGAGLLATGIDTLVRALHDGAAPLAMVAGIVVLAAALFLYPRTVRAGGITLLLVVSAVLVERALRGQWRLELIVYAAGIWYVVVHGAAWGRNARSPDLAA